MKVIQDLLCIGKEKARQQTVRRHGNRDIEKNGVKTRGCAMDEKGLPEFPNHNDLQKGPDRNDQRKEGKGP